MSVIVGRVLAGGMPAGKDPPLANLTVKELEAICEKEGVKVPAKARKADIIAAIEVHRGG